MIRQRSSGLASSQPGPFHATRLITRRSPHLLRRAWLIILVVFLGVYAFGRSRVPLPDAVKQGTHIIKHQAARYLPVHFVEEDEGGDIFQELGTKPTKTPEPKIIAVDFTRQDGRVIIPLPQPETRRLHPIPALMQRAQARWDDLQSKQSKTLAQAVKRYKSTTGRSPPKGFDRWYAFCRHHNVRMIDEYRLIDDAIRPFFALSPENFRKRVEYVSQWPVTRQGWGMEVKRGQIRLFGNDAKKTRAQDTLDLIDSFVKELPDFTSYHTAADGPHIWLSGDERARLEALAASGQFDSRENEDADYLSKAFTPPIGPMPQTCPIGTPMREEGFIYGVAPNNTLMPPLPEGAAAIFVGEVRPALDICRNPQIRHSHAAISWTFPLPGSHLPIFAPGVHGYFADLPSIVTEQFDPDERDDTPWEARTDPRLLWRGQTSGCNWLRQWPWKSSQRARLHLLAQDGTGTPEQVYLDARNGSGVYELKVPAHTLNAAFLDVGMHGPAVQCDKNDGTCDEMTRVFKGYKSKVSIAESKRYKFELDVDGNSWSGRFRRLMLSSAVVFKATIFPQFWTDWAIPWLHYVPISVDYSDMWDALAYFRGGIYSEDGHDEDAKLIATAGQQFANDYLRWDDMVAYQFRLMLEYARLYSLDRKASGTSGADYLGSGEHEPVW